MLHPAARPRGPLAEEPRASGRRVQARPQVRGVRPARGRRVTARQAGHRVRVVAAGTDGAGVRPHFHRLLKPVQEEGLDPAARRGIHVGPIVDRIGHDVIWVDMGEVNMRQCRDAGN